MCIVPGCETRPSLNVVENDSKKKHVRQAGFLYSFDWSEGEDSSCERYNEIDHSMIYTLLGGGFKYFLFSSLFGEDPHFDSYFSNGLKPPTRLGLPPLTQLQSPPGWHYIFSRGFL